MLPQALQTLVDEFAKLPGVGPRTAERLAIYVLRSSAQQAQSLADALSNLHPTIKFCRLCHNLSESDICPICQDSQRADDVLCIVEDALDVLAIERTSTYRGRYHVLGGAISPIDGIGPDQLNLKSLFQRLATSKVKEIILATNPNTEGEATAMYIQKHLPIKPKTKIRVTRLASGLPMGSDLEYADQITLSRALEGRRLF